MSRAGREPAEDVKRRIVAACKQVDLEVQGAKMYLRHEHGDRVLRVYASSPTCPCEQASIGITAIMTLGGNWSGELDIRCAACDVDSDPPRVWEIPVMRGRHAVPLEDLVEALKRTLEEQEQVIAAMKMGIEGPFRFEQTCWERPSGIGDASDLF